MDGDTHKLTLTISADVNDQEDSYIRAVHLTRDKDKSSQEDRGLLPYLEDAFKKANQQT